MFSFNNCKRLLQHPYCSRSGARLKQIMEKLESFRLAMSNKHFHFSLLKHYCFTMLTQEKPVGTMVVRKAKRNVIMMGMMWDD